MKKIILGFALFFVSFHAHSQQGFVFGLQGGPQSTSISNRNDKDASVNDYKAILTWGYSGMVKVGYNIGPPFGIHSGIIYSSQGQKNSFVDSTSGEQHINRRSLNYLKIPLLIHMSSNPGPAMFVLEFGPQFAILQNAIHYLDGNITAPGVDPTLLYEKAEIEIAWGIGADIYLNDYVSLSIMHRGDFCPIDVEDKTAQIAPGVDYYPFDRVKSNNLNIGIMIGLTTVFNPKLRNKFDKRLYWKR